MLQTLPHLSHLWTSAPSSTLRSLPLCRLGLVPFALGWLVAARGMGVAVDGLSGRLALRRPMRTWASQRQTPRPLPQPCLKADLDGGQLRLGGPLAYAWKR